MDDLLSEVIEAVDELSKEFTAAVATIDDDINILLNVHYNMSGYMVEFMGHIIWASNADNRDYDDDTNTFEPVIYYLRRTLSSFLITVGKLST